jgi:hypothetical protein
MSSGQDHQEAAALCRSRISRIATFAGWASALAAMAAGGFLAYGLFEPDHLIIAAIGAPVGILVPPSAAAKAVALVLAAVPALAFLAAMLEARRLFKLLSDGDVFVAATARSLTMLGGYANFIAAAGVAARTPIALLVTSANPAGQRALVIGVGSGEVASFIAGLLFLSFALVMREANSLAEENRSFV